MTTEADVCWRHLAEAEAEHDVDHARRAVAELIRLGELVPGQRGGSETSDCGGTMSR